MITKIDACINYYGKPYQTMVTIATLLQYSEQYIDKIYLVVENNQPNAEAWRGVARIESMFKEKIHLFFPNKHIPYLSDFDAKDLPLDDVLNIKYEIALRNSDKKYVLILHNDMLFESDLLGRYIESVNHSSETITGVGYIGQCWNCPAFAAKVCNSAIFPQFKPTYQEVLDLYQTQPSQNTARAHKTLAKEKFFPMPECRLNEHFCLINTEIYRKATLPQGIAPYFGGVWDGGDTATAWFYSMINQGYQFKHISFEEGAIHGPFSSTGSGAAADTNVNVYIGIETKAKEYMEKYFDLKSFSLLTELKGHWIRFKNRNIIRKILKRVN
jgi:hypothetical protein